MATTTAIIETAETLQTVLHRVSRQYDIDYDVLADAWFRTQNEIQPRVTRFDEVATDSTSVSGFFALRADRGSWESVEDEMEALHGIKPGITRAVREVHQRITRPLWDDCDYWMVFVPADAEVVA
jgi:hypothetical protein